VSVPLPDNENDEKALSFQVDTKKKKLYQIARDTDQRRLRQIVGGPKINVVNASTDEMYVSDISLCMLEHFCGKETINGLLLGSLQPQTRPDILPAYAPKGGIIRVIRYMRRWCLTLSIHPTGELRKPSNIKEGISSNLACRFFHPHADAERFENLVLNNFMGNPEFFIIDEGVELIWCDYEGRLRDTQFGDAVVWFVL
jgi:hypothetical protein